jgi:hypothetical protein
MILRAAFALCVFSTACAADGASGPDNVVLDKPFDVKVGQTAVLPAEGLRVVFQEVRNDSRCPTNVTCVWEGDAEVVLQAETTPETREELLVHTSRQFGDSAAFHGYTIQVRGLAPGTKAGVPTDPKAYVVTLVVSHHD